MKTPVSTLALVAISLPALAAAPRDTVTRWEAGAWTVWRIDRPSLSGSVSGLAPLLLQPGDTLVLAAGGCAATGAGPVSVGEAALATIPGTTTGATSLRALVDRELEVTRRLAGDALSFDLASPRTAALDGAATGRCSGEAFLLIAVRTAASQDASSAPPAPMDLLGTPAREINGIAMNPRWGSQVTSGTLGDPVACFALPGWFTNPACTGQPTDIDEGSGLNSVICSLGSTTPLAGHVNWRPGTYAGPVSWDHHSVGDSDYNMKIPPVTQNGLTLANTTAIKGEFDSRETVDYFSSPWWTSFRDASDGDKQTMIDGRETIMIGLVGTDCEHDCESEVHPVWGLAIHVKDDPLDDVWAIFARNWGNEGFCSSLDHLIALPGNRLSFRLPWRRGADAVASTGATVFYANEPGMSYGVGTLPGKAVTMTVQLLSPYDHGRVHGDLHLRWVGASAAARSGAPVVMEHEEEEEDEARSESWIEEIVASLDPAQRSALEAELASTAPQHADGIVVARDEALLPAGELAGCAVTTLPDNLTAAANSRRLLAVRRAYGRQLPGARGEAVERAYLQAGR